METNGSRAVCKNGLIVSALEPSLSNSILYLFGLLYCFLGIAIAADCFMCSIEKITSTTRKVRLRRSKRNRLVAEKIDEEPGDECEQVRVWNPTVANLTLMALGSSAPEILLSIIEIMGNSFRAGDLGPGTIVGSAAFNLLCITAICILAIPSPKTSRIQEISVFGVTSFFSCLAYIWLLLMLVVISPNVVEIWEAALTLTFFLILIVCAYLADVKVWRKRRSNYEEELESKLTYQGVESADIDKTLRRFSKEISIESNALAVSNAVPDHDTIHSVSRQISKIYPTLSLEDKAKLLAYKINKNQVHDRLYYRIHAARKLAGADRKTVAEREVEASLKGSEETDFSSKAITENNIEFSARVYAVRTGDSRVNLRVIRHGSTSKPFSFCYTTVNGTAKKDLHFLNKTATARFRPDENVCTVYIELIKEASWRKDHVFYVQLKLGPNDSNGEKTILGRTSIASIRMPDHSNSFVGEPMVQFVRKQYIVKESVGYARLFVERIGRHDARSFDLFYETEAITARGNIDYANIGNGLLKFIDNEYEKYIDIRIFDDMQEEKDETFNVRLLRATQDVTLGPNNRTVVTIVCDDNVLKNITNVRKLTSHYLHIMTLQADSWTDQIRAASSVNGGDIANATFMDCMLHTISFPWKMLVALIPPTSILGGWMCFIVALSLIGFITAIIGDLASIFGCMIGLKDTITAITFVALGTSLPDTFASKIAAENEATADNAVGNVTGSNSVNVFLGLGLPWLIASIYWTVKNESFVVDAGNLSFSVTVFMIASILCLLLLIIRRKLSFFGKAELGGPFFPKLLSASFLIFLWLSYVLLSVLQAYEIPPF